MTLYRPKDAAKLDALHPDLRRVILRAAGDGARFIVICTVRGEAEQTAAKKGGNSKAAFGQSPHNFFPALAIDLGPANYATATIDDYKALRDDIMQAAHIERVPVVWGGNWKMRDYPHFELQDWQLMKGRLAK